MLVFGLLSTCFDLLTFVLLRRGFEADAPTFQTGWFLVSVLTELVVLLLLRTSRPAWTSSPSRLLVVSTLSVAAVSVALPWCPAAAAAFGLVPLPAPLLLALAAVVAGYAAFTELAKRRYHAR